VLALDYRGNVFRYDTCSKYAWLEMQNAVKLFSHNECIHSLVVRRFLLQQGIPFEEYDVERSPGAMEALLNLSDSAKHVPILSVNGLVFMDFDDKVARRILSEAKGPDARTNCQSCTLS